MGKNGTTLPRMTVHVRQKWHMMDVVYLPTYQCGHRDHRDFEVVIVDGDVEEAAYGPKPKRNLCSACIKSGLEERVAASIRCFACKHLIMPGHGIRLRGVSGETPAHATVVQSPHGPSMVGCMSMDCASDGMCYHGNWSAEGVLLPRDKEHAGGGLELIPDMKGELYPLVSSNAA